MCLQCFDRHVTVHKFMILYLCPCVCMCVEGKGPEWGARTGSKKQTTHSCYTERVGVRKCVGAWHSQKHTISHIQWGSETEKKKQIAIYWYGGSRLKEKSWIWHSKFWVCYSCSPDVISLMPGNTFRHPSAFSTVSHISRWRLMSVRGSNIGIMCGRWVRCPAGPSGHEQSMAGSARSVCGAFRLSRWGEWSCGRAV